MGTSWCGLFKMGGDGQCDFLIEMQPKEAVHNKMVKIYFYYQENFMRKRIQRISYKGILLSDYNWLD